MIVRERQVRVDYPVVLTEFSGLADADPVEYSPFLDPRSRGPLLRDPKVHVLQTAELGEADILCTHD